MPLQYRLVAATDGTSDISVARVREQLSSWLHEKGYDGGDVAPGSRRVSGQAHLLVAEQRPVDGSHVWRSQLRETSSTPRQATRWVTTVTVASQGRDQPSWIWVDLDAVPLDDGREPPPATTPRIARMLLEVLDLRRGRLRLRPDARLVHDLETLEELVEDLVDEARELPLVVLSHDPTDPEASALRAARIAGSLPGLALTYRLDAPATSAFNQVVGSDHHVFGGALRSYLPRVDVSDAADARRHKVMRGSSFDENPGRGIRVIASSARATAANAPLPQVLARIATSVLPVDHSLAALRSLREDAAEAAEQARGAVDRAGAGTAARQPGTSADARPDAPGTQATVPADRGQDRREVRELEELSQRLVQLEQHVERLVDEVQETADRARDSEAAQRDSEAALADVRTQYEDEIAEHDGSRGERDDALDQVRWLQQRLAELGDVEAYTAVPDPDRTEAPLNLEDLLDKVGQLSRVRFTHTARDRGKTLALDEDLKSAIWARKAWEALTALEDYAGACADGSFSGNFHAWCKSPPPGRRHVSANVVTLVESEQTMTNGKFAAARRFPVPAEVTTSDELEMWAHIKLEKHHPPCPRMHFHDDTAGTGLVYVGYLGPHLPNTKTN